MEGQPSNKMPNRMSPVTFLVLVFLMSSIFWFLGAVAQGSLPKETAIDLPISSLMAVCPMIAALILVHRENGSVGVKELFKRCFDYRRIKSKVWYIPILFLMPLIMVMVNIFKGNLPAAVPVSQPPVLMVLISCVLFFIAALTEEIGWQGYAFDPLQARWNALIASLVLGFLWAIWHSIPFIQMHQSTSWIVWQSTNILLTRIIIVWLYNNTGKSLFAAILYHSMYNVSTILLPSFGLTYYPMVTTIILAGIVLVVIVLWGPKTLASYRHTRTSIWGKFSFHSN